MKVLNHLLDGAPLKASPDHGGIIRPEAIIIHYTGGGSAKGSIDWLTRADENYVSAHLVIDREGAVTQLVPFNRRAWHAGRSVWNGRKDVNSWAVGIELANWGPLGPDRDAEIRLPDHSMLPRTRAVLMPHRNDPKQTPRLWETYPSTQVNTCRDVCRALREAYAISMILGHDDVAPDRKIDPGPAFPMAWLRKEVGV